MKFKLLSFLLIFIGILNAAEIRTLKPLKPKNIISASDLKRIQNSLTISKKFKKLIDHIYTNIDQLCANYESYVSSIKNAIEDHSKINLEELQAYKQKLEKSLSRFKSLINQISRIVLKISGIFFIIFQTR